MSIHAETLATRVYLHLKSKDTLLDCSVSELCELFCIGASGFLNREIKLRDFCALANEIFSSLPIHIKGEESDFYYVVHSSIDLEYYAQKGIDISSQLEIIRHYFKHKNLKAYHAQTHST